MVSTLYQNDDIIQENRVHFLMGTIIGQTFLTYLAAELLKRM
jgi:hypothetical protein